MVRKYFVVIFGFLFVFCSAGSALAEDGKGPCTIMQPDGEALLNWIHDYEMAPRAYIDKSIDISSMSGGSFSLLSHLKYNAAERDQGNCGNGWAWAGTGVMGIALDVQEQILDRLSAQFISSCNTAKSCCDGGWLTDFASFYASAGYTIPWSNTNASWKNGDGKCNVPCSSIGTSPNYGIDSIVAEVIETHDVGQAEAIANIKNVLHQNRAVSFLWFFPTQADKNNFWNFWDTQGEGVTTTLDYCCGKT